MGLPRYLITNLLAAASAITPSTEDADYPKANLYNSRPGKPFKFTSTSGGNIVIDLGSPANPTVAAIINHNMTAAATVKIQANSSDVWTTPPIDETMTFRAGNMFKCFAGASYRYWRLLISGSGGAANIRLGELWLGSYIEFTRGPQYPVDEDKKYQNAALATVLGQEWSYELYSAIEYAYKYRLYNSEKAELEAIRDNAGNGRLPVLWIPDSAETPCYMAKAVLGALKNSGPYRYETTLKIKEMPNGKEL